MLHGCAMMIARDGTPLTQPTAPQNHQAAATGSSSISQTWDDLPNEDTYEVQRAKNSSFTSDLVTDTLSKDAVSKSWTGLASSTKYFFRVRGINGAGNGDWSTTAEATTTASGSPPSTPTGNSLSTVSATRLDQSWNDVSGETGYDAQRALNSGFTSGVVTDTSIGENVTSKSWTGLAEGTKYFARVRAKNSHGTSSWSSTAEKYTKLATPTSLEKTIFSGFVRLTWSDNSSKEGNYEIYKDGALFDTVAANTEQYDVSNPSAVGDWKVRAVASGIPASDFSNTVNVSSGELQGEV